MKQLETASPLKTLFKSHEDVGLNRLGFLCFVFVDLIGLYLVKWWFEIKWPLATLPLGLAMFLAAMSYGMDKGIRGKPLGDSYKSWIIARQMVLTTLAAVVALITFALVFDGPSDINVLSNAALIAGAEFSLCMIVSFVLCRYAFVFGVKRGYSAFLKKEKQSQ